MSNHTYLVQAERKYAILLHRYETAEHATEVIVGVKALAEADARIQAERKKLTAEMARIADTIQRLCDPEWTPDHIHPLRPFKLTRKMGELAKITYKVMRQERRPMSSWELARIVAERVGVADGKGIERIANNITNTMNNRVKAGQVEKIGAKPARWAIKPLASAASATAQPTRDQSAA